jgi:nicotinamidase-related amidase
MKRALLVIDVQNEYFTGRMPVTYPKGSLSNILRAMDAADACGIPVILIQHTAQKPDAPTFRRGSKEWELHSSVLSRGHECIVEKHLPGGFTETGLSAHLRRLGADTVTICGYMSQMCCDTTARQANHQGYAVEFLSDATGTLALSNYSGSITAEELHRCVLVTQAAGFSKVLSTDDWIQLSKLTKIRENS